MVAHACNPRAWEIEAAGAQIPGKFGLASETMFQKEKKIWWGHGSSGKAPAWQTQGSEFKSQYSPPSQKDKKKE